MMISEYIIRTSFIVLSSVSISHAGGLRVERAVYVSYAPFVYVWGRVATHRTYENCVNEEEERFLQNENPLYYCC